MDNYQWRKQQFVSVDKSKYAQHLLYFNINIETEQQTVLLMKH